MTTNARQARRRRTFGAVAVVALLALSACGAAEGDGVASAGGEENPANPVEAEDTAPLDEDAQALIFAECMRDNGIDMSDPGPGQQGLVEALQSVSRNYDRKTMRQALSACQGLMPQYASQQHPTGDDWMLDLAECLREQGLDVSDNPFDDAHSGKIDVNEFSAAMEVCREVLTGGGA
ncbi:MAG: hypothetical protein ACRDQW_16410 [Haloechinothrix sp.]